MSPGEIGWRLEVRLRQEWWARRRFDPPRVVSSNSVPSMPYDAELGQLSRDARQAIVAAADGLLRGRAVVLGTLREDMDDPDWALDPRSGIAYPRRRCALEVDYRGPADERDPKQVWELSRHHHLTVLASAWRLTGDERYASATVRQLGSWWSQNPAMTGINWTNGIELGIRLISWVWIRRLLDGWHSAPAAFEHNDLAIGQIYWHQRYLADCFSRGSSANNHVVAEAAGWLAASCAFPWFAESERWQKAASALLQRELEHNTFRDGVNREQAFEYHAFVAELALAAAAEAEAAGVPLAPAFWEVLCHMLDVVAAVLDRSARPPRYGDGDGGRALVLDDPLADRWGSLLAAGAAVFGAKEWWPRTAPDARSILVAGMVGRRVEVQGRPATRPSHFPDAGMTILRSPRDADEEIWCRCDGGPHGFLSIAAHAHADALSIEVRHDGVELLVDPGTYGYFGEPRWRRYFRSTLAHNTIELDGRDQSDPGGPFLWLRHAQSEIIDLELDGEGAQRWSAQHRAYGRLGAPVRHRRSVVLDPQARSLFVVDRLDVAGPHPVRMTYHLGPSVEVALEPDRASLRWKHPSGQMATATVRLPPELTWTAYRGSTDPILGWYSSELGHREPVTTLLGRGLVRRGETVLRSELQLGHIPSARAMPSIQDERTAASSRAASTSLPGPIAAAVGGAMSTDAATARSSRYGDA